MQIDVVEFFMGERSWQQFYVFFEHLPSWSKTKSKIASDPELAKAQLSQIPKESIQKIVDERAEKKEKKPEIPLEGYDLKVEKLSQIIDKIEVLTFIVKYMLSSKGPQGDQPKILGRPETAFEKALEDEIWKHEKSDADELKKALGF